MSEIFNKQKSFKERFRTIFKLWKSTSMLKRAGLKTSLQFIKIFHLKGIFSNKIIMKNLKLIGLAIL